MGSDVLTKPEKQEHENLMYMSYIGYPMSIIQLCRLKDLTDKVEKTLDKS